MAVMIFPITIMVMTMMIIQITVKYVQHGVGKNAMYLSVCTSGMCYIFVPVYMPFPCARQVRITD